MTAIRALVFSMREHGHFQRLRPLIRGLCAAGVECHVFTDSRFQAGVEAAGGIFHDLFRGRPLDDADNSSRPIPCRYVSFAAYYSDGIIREAAALNPQLVVHNSFAVIATPVATALGLPRICLCAGHNQPPGVALAELRVDPRVQLSEVCHRAVETLRRDFGMTEASPFSYVDNLSADLNVISEPPQFLTAEECEPFRPFAFFGSLDETDFDADDDNRKENLFPASESGAVHLYVSFGTIIWRYYADYAWSVLEAVSQAAAQRDDLAVLIGLGGEDTTSERDGLARQNVRVEPYVNQWRTLSRADVFLTHNGLNSTHEAIFHGVPMLSCPFFHDQPGLARRCHELGLAEPLTLGVRTPVSAEDVHTTLDRLLPLRETMNHHLMQARQWELDVIAKRPVVIERIAAFADTQAIRA